jgi:aminodeoxychorismate lyase
MPNAAVSTDDRSFLYGDGLFETLLALEGRVLWPELHLDRLMLGCERLGIPGQRAAAEELLASLEIGEPAAVLRLSLSRGSGPRGYAPPEFSEPVLRLTQHSAPALPADSRVDVVLSPVNVAAQPLLAGIKHCNRLEQVLAAQDARARGAGEALMTTGDGEVQCAISANVFAVSGRTLITPPVDRAGVAGTRRRLVLERLARQVGLDTEVTSLRVDRCRRADALILTNSVHGIRAVRRLDDTDFPGANDAVHALQGAYMQEVRRCLGS